MREALSIEEAHAALERNRLAEVRRMLEEVIAPLREELKMVRRALPPALVDIQAFCELADVSPATARRWASSGQVKTVRRGRVLRFDASSLTIDDDQVRELAAKARAR